MAVGTMSGGMRSLFLLLALAPVCSSLSTIVYGPGSLELRLLTAKLAARDGFDSSLYAGDEDRVAKQCRSWLYGKEYANAGIDAPGNAKVLQDTEDLGAALAAATNMCLVCDCNPLPEGVLGTLLANTPSLKRIVLLSKMGVTRAKPGPFGMPNGDVALFENEKTIRSQADARDVELSIVRVGSLKGGGPGELEDGSKNVGDDELGLAKPYYDGIVDLSTYMITQSHDRFTVGAKLLPGDPTDLPNAFMRKAMGDSFEARDDETNRIVAAAAAVHALCRHPTPVDISVGAAKATALPTVGEWEDLFAAL